MTSKTPRKRCRYENVDKDQYLSEIQYYKVIKKADQNVDVQNERGFEFSIAKPILEEGCWSANQYEKEKKVSLTECVKKMLDAKADVFTVNFNKKANAESHSKVLQNAKITDLTDPKGLKKISKELEKGEERTMICHLVEAEPLLGRSKVIDLEEHFRNIERKKKKEQTKFTLKQVDHRHINWMVLNNVKYIVK
jgi:hypothetical protein